MRAWRVAGLIGASALLYACASAPPPPAPFVPPAPAPQRPRPPAGLGVADLPGWDQEDHAAALTAFAAGCGVSTDAAQRAVCDRARALGPADDASARAFFEANFQVERVAGQGLMTGYFSPRYEARAEPDAEFSAPARPLPSDLQVLNLGQFDPSLAGKRIVGRVSDDRFVPYADRAEIDGWPGGDALAWMRPEELFFMQIQGSGLLVFPDGRRLRAAYAGSNGRPFVGVAQPLREQGALTASDASGGAVMAWLADHRGLRAQAVMDEDPRYVFFKLAPDTGGAVGAAGVALTPGRALAVDPAYHPLGGLYWIDAETPGLEGGYPSYRRLAMALDVGGAIKGPVRADLYIGEGADAGVEAGRIRHALTLYRLEPVP